MKNNYWHEIGEENNYSNFPEDYQAEHLKGKTQILVKLHEIKQRVIPELSDVIKELDIEGINTAEEYRTLILEKLQTEKKQMVENTLSRT